MKPFTRNTKHRYHVRIIVSVLAEHKGKFVFISEMRLGRRSLSEPVGHVEPGENLLRAAIAEFFEETGMTVSLQSIIGIYYNIYNGAAISDSIRVAFFGHVKNASQEEKQEKDIHPFWVKRSELPTMAHRLSHPTGRRALRDFLDGKRFPLTTITELRVPLSKNRERRRTSSR